MDGFFGMSGEEIYRNFTEATGGGDQAAGAAMVKELQEEYEQEAAALRALAVRMESAWQGDAAGAAQRGAVPLAAEHELNTPQLFTAQDLVSRQVGSFGGARNSVVPVPPAPDKPSGFEILFSPQALPTYERKLAEHNAAAQQNVDIMDGYDGASSFNGDNLPTSYGSITADSAGIAVAPPSSDSGDRGDGGSPGSGDDGGGRPPTGVSWLPHDGSEGSASPGGGPSSPVTSGVPPQRTGPEAYVPPAPATPALGPAVPGGPPVASGGGGVPPVAGFVPGWPGGGSGLGGPGGSGGGPGGRGAVGGPGGSGGPGVGGRPGGGDVGHGPGGRMGAGPVAGGAAAEAAGRGAAGARGAVGGAGVPMGLGSGRSRGDEDTERRAPKYLEEYDPEGMFGTDELTAPPVIGESDEPDVQPEGK